MPVFYGKSQYFNVHFSALLKCPFSFPLCVRLYTCPLFSIYAYVARAGDIIYIISRQRYDIFFICANIFYKKYIIFSLFHEKLHFLYFCAPKMCIFRSDFFFSVHLNFSLFWGPIFPHFSAPIKRAFN